MARYSLIMKDETYVKLIRKATDEGISMGRLLNDIIEAYAEDVLPPTQIKCLYCNEKPAYRVILNERYFYMCESHFAQNKNLLEGYKQLEE